MCSARKLRAKIGGVTIVPIMRVRNFAAVPYHRTSRRHSTIFAARYELLSLFDNDEAATQLGMMFDMRYLNCYNGCLVPAQLVSKTEGSFVPLLPPHSLRTNSIWSSRRDESGTPRVACVASRHVTRRVSSLFATYMPRVAPYCHPTPSFHNTVPLRTVLCRAVSRVELYSKGTLGYL